MIVVECTTPPTLYPRPLPERDVSTYRDALIHRAELIEFGFACELDKRAARESLAEPFERPQPPEGLQ